MFVRKFREVSLTVIFCHFLALHELRKNWEHIMYHKFLTVMIIAIVMTNMSQVNAKKLNSAELKSLFSNTLVNWTNQKGNKITLSLNSDGSAKVLIVTPQRKVKREGKWWIKKSNIHCVKWVKRKKNTCRRIGNVEKSGEGWTTNRNGIIWTITKIKETTIASEKAFSPSKIKEIFDDSVVQFINGNAKVTLWLKANGEAKVLAILPQREVKNHGTWWIKEPNIHCVKWVAPNRRMCRAVNNFEKRESGHVATVNGVTWSISKGQATDTSNIVPNVSQEKIAEALKLMAAAVMKIVPKRMDVITVLSSAASNKDTLTYNYILDLEKDEISSSLISSQKDQIKKQLCGKKQLRLMTKIGVKFQYSYYSKNGSKLMEFIFGKGDCI